MASVRDLALKVWPDLKIMRIQIGERWGHSSLEMKWGTFLENHTWVFLAPCDGAESWGKRRGTFFELLLCPGQQGCHFDNFAGSISPPDQQKRGDFYRTLSRLPRPSLSRHIISLSPLGILFPITRPNPIVLGVKVVFNIKFLLITEKETVPLNIDYHVYLANYLKNVRITTNRIY